MNKGSDDNLSEIEKDKAIKKEIKKLEETLRDIQKDKIKMAEGLIANAAFMSVTLQELKKEINSNGAITLYNKNPVENPATKSYNTMINRYSSVMSQLFNLMPKEDRETNQNKDDSKSDSKISELKAFVTGGSK